MQTITQPIESFGKVRLEKVTAGELQFCRVCIGNVQIAMYLSMDEAVAKYDKTVESMYRISMDGRLKSGEIH